MLDEVERDDDSLLTADRIRGLLSELDDELSLTGQTGELFLVGGAAMALGYDAREATRDVDALFEPKRELYAAAVTVAQRHGLAADWLNDAMKGFLHGDDPNRRVVFEHPSLKVYVASPRYLLAMKLHSARVERDADDIALLLQLSGIGTVEEALDLVEAAYGKDRLTVKTQLLLEAILAGDQETNDTNGEHDARS